MTNKQINVINVNEGDVLLIQHSEATDIEMATLWHNKISETLEGTAISLITVTPHAQLTVLKNNGGSTHTKGFTSSDDATLKRQEG